MPTTGALKQYWDLRLDALDWKHSKPEDRRSWIRAYETFLAPATRDAVELLGDLRDRRLLELACGQGYGSLHLARRGARVTGIDISEKRCRTAARELARTEAASRMFVCNASAERLPFADESFDLIFSRDVLMYADRDRIIRECLRVLAPGGKVVFIESLEGNPLLRGFRRWTSSADYRSFVRHLRWSQMRCIGGLQPVVVRPYYLLSLTAFFALFVLRSVYLHRVTLGLLYPVDRLLLRMFPGLSALAWRATALYRKPESSW